MSATTNAAAGIKDREPVLDGWFTLDPHEPHLLGSQCSKCKTYYFPKISGFCKNPACDNERFETVKLSRYGKLWSFTNAEYQPPAPYVSSDPFIPFTIAAVQLEKEKMIVLGQMVTGVNVSDLKLGMTVELVLETLSQDDAAEKITWKWKPCYEQ